VLFERDCCGNFLLGFSSQQAPRLALGYAATGTVEILELDSPAPLLTLAAAEPDQLADLFLSLDGQRLVTVLFDKSVHLWDLTTGQKLYTLPPLAAPEVILVQFSPDSRWLALGDCRGTVTVWEAATGHLKQTLTGPAGCVTSAAFSLDGTLIATGGASTRGHRIYDLGTGRELLVLPGGFGVNFTPDGKHVTAGVFESVGLAQLSVRMYTLDLAEIMALARTRVTRALTPAECQEFLHMETCP
jgi:WD40 repeat protein